ncbi:MAG: FMN-binding negative transcriptional regulator [Pseudomonadota bacterium]
MHPNPAFRTETDEQNIAFVRKRSFGILTINAEAGPLVSHIPFLLSPDATEVELHLVRSNPIVRQISEPTPAALVVTGGDAYVSPDWYHVDDQVPTWNYVAVHLRGEISLLPHSDLHGVLERLSAAKEERLLPKKPWTSDKMDQEVYERMQRQIVPAKLIISEINGTWKLSQNKPDAVRLSAADGVEASAVGAQTGEIAELMRGVKSSS